VSKKEPARHEEFFIPTPEELERGVFSRRRRRRRSEKDESRTDKRSPSRSRRLFSRLRRGVGQERTEARAPRQIAPSSQDVPSPPPQDPPDSGGRSPAGGVPDSAEQSSREVSQGPSPQDPPSSGGRSPAGEVPDSAEQSSREMSQGPSSQVGSSPKPSPIPSQSSRPSGVTRPKARRPPVQRPVSGPKASVTPKKRVRKIAVPKHRPPPSIKKADAVPDWLAKQVRVGHDLSAFKPRPRLDPHEQVYVASCNNCGEQAFARRVAPPGYTLKDNGRWERLAGRVTEKVCGV